MIVYIKKDAIIDLSYSLSKNIQYKCIWILFEVGCLHQHTAIALYRLDRNGKLLQFFRILITAVYFNDQKWISKTVHCISCFMVCKKTQAIAKHFAFYANAINVIASKKLTTTETFAFIAVLVKLLSCKVLFINRKDNRSC